MRFDYVDNNERSSTHSVKPWVWSIWISTIAFWRGACCEKISGVFDWTGYCHLSPQRKVSTDIGLHFYVTISTLYGLRQMRRRRFATLWIDRFLGHSIMARLETLRQPKVGQQHEISTPKSSCWECYWDSSIGSSGSYGPVTAPKFAASV